MPRLALLLLLLATGPGCVTPRPVAKVLFWLPGSVAMVSGTAAVVGPGLLVTANHVAVGDKCKVFPWRVASWIAGEVVYRTATYALLYAPELLWGFRPGDSGAPMIDQHGRLLGHVEQSFTLASVERKIRRDLDGDGQIGRAK